MDAEEFKEIIVSLRNGSDKHVFNLYNSDILLDSIREKYGEDGLVKIINAMVDGLWHPELRDQFLINFNDALAEILKQEEKLEGNPDLISYYASDRLLNLHEKGHRDLRVKDCVDETMTSIYKHYTEKHKRRRSKLPDMR